MTRTELIHLQYSLRALRASITGLEEAIPRARYPDLIQLELHRLKQSEAELVRRVVALPKLAAAYATGKMPPLMLGTGDAS